MSKRWNGIAGFCIGENLQLVPEKAEADELSHPSLVAWDLRQPHAQAAFWASLIDQTNNHTKLLAVLSPTIPVRPWTIMSPTVDMKSFAQAAQMWTIGQFAVAKAVCDAVKDGDITADEAAWLGFGVQVFIHPKAVTVEGIFQTNYAGVRQCIINARDDAQNVTHMLDNADVIHALVKLEKAKVGELIAACWKPQ